MGVQWCLWGREYSYLHFISFLQFQCQATGLEKRWFFSFFLLWTYRQENEALYPDLLYRNPIHWIAWPVNDYFYFQFIILSRLTFQHSASPRRKTNQHFHTLRCVQEFLSNIDCGPLKAQAENTLNSAANGCMLCCSEGLLQAACCRLPLGAWGLVETTIAFVLQRKNM